MIMRTDVRLIAGAVVLLMIAALWCMATGSMLLCIVPMACLCGILHHINGNKEYYEGQIDDMYGNDDELV